MLVQSNFPRAGYGSGTGRFGAAACRVVVREALILWNRQGCSHVPYTLCEIAELTVPAELGSIFKLYSACELVTVPPARFINTVLPVSW